MDNRTCTALFTAVATASLAVSIAVLVPEHAARAVPASVSIYPPTAMPANTSGQPDSRAIEVGERFVVSRPGVVTALGFWKAVGNTGPHVASLWTGTGRRIASVAFTHESASGWQTAALARPIRLVPRAAYFASVHDPHGRFAAQVGYFTTHRLLGNPTIAAILGAYQPSATSVFPARGSHAAFYVNVGFAADPAPAWPDSSNTGVPAGIGLTASGSITVGTAGVTISGKDIRGCIDIDAPNVTIQNSRVTATGCGENVIQINSTGAHLTNVEVNGSNSTAVTSCIGWGDYTAVRVNLHNCSDGARANGSVTIRDSYIHDLYVAPNSHNDGIQTTEGAHLVIDHNRVENPADQTSAVMIGADQGAVSDVHVTNNLLAGGGYTLYGGQGGSYSISGIAITGNRFSTRFYPASGYWGPMTAVDGAAITVSGNAWADGPRAGQPIS